MAVPGKKTSQKLSNTICLGGAEDFDIICDQCDRDDIRLPAFGYCVDCEVHLCQTCFNTHRRPKLLRHHNLLDKEHMPHKQDFHKSLKSTSGQQDGDFGKPCTKHTKEVIKFYCHDHNTLTCSVCVTLEHPTRSCNVGYIPDISGQIVDSKDFKETLMDIDKLIEKCCQITKDLKQRVAKSSTSLIDTIAEIENYRTEINQRLDELEMEVKDTATTIQHDNNKTLKTKETACDDIKKSLQVSADTLKQLNTNRKTDQLFIDLTISRHLIKDCIKKTTQLQTNADIDEYIFEPNHAIKKLFQNEKSLGTVIRKVQRKPARPKNKAAVPMKISSPRNIDGKTSSDETECWFTAITVSPQGQLFVVDTGNFSIKMIDIKSGAIKQLMVKDSPWGITIVTRNTLAVTLDMRRTIQFISFSSNSISLKNKFIVDGECLKISHHQGKLAVTFSSPAKLEIMDLKGNNRIVVETNSNEEVIFSYPEYVTTNSHLIYVSDIGVNEVTWFNWQGEMIGRNADIGRPRGISLFDDGSLFLSDYLTKCIYRVSGDCKDMTTVLENVEYPEAVCWSAETSTFYLSTYNWLSDVVSNHIKLYKMVKNQ